MAGVESKERYVSWVFPGIAAVGLHLFVLHLASAAPEVANTGDVVASTVDLNFEVPLEPEGTDPTQATDGARQSAPGTNSRSEKSRTKVSRARVNTATPTSSPAEETVSQRMAKSEQPTGESLPAEPDGTATQGNQHLGGSTEGGTTAGGSSASNHGDLHNHLARSLANKPRLLSPGDACQGLFSSSADGTSRLTMVLAVNENGQASPTLVRASSAASQRAVERVAQLCAQRLRFIPARDAAGKIVAASSIVSLSINKRHSTARYAAREGAI